MDWTYILLGAACGAYGAYKDWSLIKIILISLIPFSIILTLNIFGGRA